jgi:hypothetical protein
VTSLFKVLSNPPHWLLLAGIVCLYLGSRLVGIRTFVPHNDEVIYAQEASFVAADWATNKYWTLDGRAYGDYRQPLLAWLGSTVVNRWEDPLRGVRLWSVFAGLMGLLATERFVARVWSPQAGLLAALLIVFSEYYLYFDSVALNEALLYGMGAAFLTCLYAGLIKPRVISIGSAALLLGAMLTTKDSARLWLGAAAVLPLLAALEVVGNSVSRVRSVLRSYAIVGAVALIGFLAHAALVPAQFNAVRDKSPQAAMVRSIAELGAFPLDDWLANARFYWDAILREELGYALIPAVVAIGTMAAWLWVKEEGQFWTFLWLAALYLALVIPLILLAKSPYVRYFGMGTYYLYILLAIALATGMAQLPARWKLPLWTGLLLLLVGCKTAQTYRPLLKWGQTDLAMRETPQGWANGLGIPELLEHLRELPAGSLLCDPQWGLPRTAIELYHRQYPQLQIVPSTKQAFDNLDQLAENARRLGGHLYIVLNRPLSSPDPWIESLLRDRTLSEHQVVIFKRFRDENLPDSMLVLCEANP